MTDGPSRDDQRDQLLEAALAHVPFDGWSNRSLFAAARDLDMDPTLARRLFPRGGDDLLAHLEEWVDRRMAEQAEPLQLQTMRMQDRIKKLIQLRLEILDPHREAMRRAISARLLPGNAATAAGAVWRTADLMWSLAGDHERDPSYYTKRSLLAGVWSATFLYWLDDRSLEHEATTAFLERRIADVMRIGEARSRLGRVTEPLSRLNPLASRRF